MDSRCKNKLTDLAKRLRPLMVNVAESVVAGSGITKIFIPAMAGITDSDVLYNFDSKLTVPATQGSQGKGIWLVDGVETCAEGWGMVPDGATSATAYVLIGTFASGYISLSTFSANVLTPNGDADYTSVDDVDITAASLTGYVNKVNPLSFSVAAGDILQMRVTRDGYSDTAGAAVSCYGFIVNFS